MDSETARQIDDLLARIDATQKKVANAVRHIELRAIIGRLGLSQVRVAQCLGTDPRTFRRWCLDEAPIPEPIARILRLADRGSINLADLLEVKS